LDDFEITNDEDEVEVDSSKKVLNDAMEVDMDTKDDFVKEISKSLEKEYT